VEQKPRRLYIEDIEKIYLEYDKQSDVLYIHFGEEEEADEAIMTENDIIIRIKGDKILGITVMDFTHKTGYEY